MAVGPAGSASSPSLPSHPPCAIVWGDDGSTRSAGSSSESYTNSVTSSAEVRITLVGDGSRKRCSKCCHLKGGCTWQAKAVSGLFALVLIVGLALAIALPIAVLQGKRAGELNQVVQVRGAGTANQPLPAYVSISGRLQVMPSQAPSSAPAKAAVAALCTAAAPITLLYDALQNGLAAAVRSLGVEGVTVAVADAQCSKGSELAFRVQLRCTSADPDLPAAVAKTLTGPAGVAAALAQLKRTTVGVFGEAGLVMLSQLRLETLVGGAGSTSGSSNNTTNDGSRGANVSAAASESAGAGDANLIDASNKAAAAAGTGAAAVQAATGVADGGDAAGVVDAAEHGAQQTAVEMADASIDGTVAADGSVSG